MMRSAAAKSCGVPVALGLAGVAGATPPPERPTILDQDGARPRATDSLPPDIGLQHPPISFRPCDRPSRLPRRA